VDGWTWRDLRVLARAKLIILPAISSTLCSVSLSLKRVRVGMEFVWCSDLLLFRSKRSLNCIMVLSYVVVVSLCCGVRCSFRWHLVLNMSVGFLPFRLRLRPRQILRRKRDNMIS
jgi:hypothetical protein